MTNEDFQLVKDIVQPDSRGRLSIGSIGKGKSYRVLVNDAGQILLDPVVAVPERELWLWKNSEAIASVRQGLSESATGETVELGSFAAYANLELEDK